MSGKPLTVEQLQTLKFRLKVHMNGGSNFSSKVSDNEEYGILYSYRTNGRPEYKYTDRTLSTEDGAIVANLLSDDIAGEMERFVEKYNARLTTKA